MGYKNFKINIVLRCLVLTGCIFTLCYLIIKTNLYFTITLMAFFVILSITSIVHYIEQTNRVLKNFLESIRYSDFTRSFEIKGKGRSFDSLLNSFNEVINDFKGIKAEKERHFFYLQTVLQHMEVSMIAYKPNGDIEWINNASKKLFNHGDISNVTELNNFSSELVDTLLKIKKDEKALIKVFNKNDILQLSIYGTTFKVEGREVILVSIKNIQHELEENEIESWQKLIRVLTHEIMNSITPISSLSETIHKNLTDYSEKNSRIISDEDKETVEDVTMALETIRKRSVGLLHFVDTYRNLTKIPKPKFGIFKVEKLVNNVTTLFKNELIENNINLEINITDTRLELSADEQLIEQVLINLVKNAIHALHNIPQAKLTIGAFINNNRKTITVSDNGHGILPEVLERVFIPFFTTKPKGSGIGLSLSKQILRLHGGTISASSEPNVETRFTLIF